MNSSRKGEGREGLLPLPAVCAMTDLHLTIFGGRFFPCRGGMKNTRAAAVREVSRASRMRPAVKIPPPGKRRDHRHQRGQQPERQERLRLHDHREAGGRVWNHGSMTAYVAAMRPRPGVASRTLPAAISWRT